MKLFSFWPFRPSSRRRQRGWAVGAEALEARQVLSVLPVSGDWNNDGTDTVGFYNNVTKQALLRNTNDAGFPTVARTVPLAATFDTNSNGVPVSGNWDGVGIDTVGVYDPETKFFVLPNDAYSTSSIAFIILPLGVGPDLVPVAGDFDNNGTDTIGLYDRTNGVFYLRNSNLSGLPDLTITFGGIAATNVPLIGDWNNDGTDSPAVFRASTNDFILTNGLGAAPAIDATIGLAPPSSTSIPLAGDWNNDGTDSFGFFDPATSFVSLKNALVPGAFDNTFYLVSTGGVVPNPSPPAAMQLTTAEVELLLKRAAAASASEDAIIAVVDREGHVLGVRVEQAVLDAIDSVANGGNGNATIDAGIEEQTLVYSIDGAVAKARTAAFFANGDKTATPYRTVGPLTSRTVRFISQSTVTQREVESNPNNPDPTSALRGPGFVAPIGIGGHFPPGIMNAPQVDLFGIEHTNRDSIIHPGPDSIKGNGDDIPLSSRFNVPVAFIPAGQEIDAPESYGFTSGRMPNAQSRGIATLPGGIPLYRGLDLVGGIGVFFPGLTNSVDPNNPIRIGDATFEQGFVPGIGQTAEQRVNAPKVLESEWIAFAAAGGSSNAGAAVGAIGACPAVPFNYPFGRIDLVGITLQLIGPQAGLTGVRTIQAVGRSVGLGNPNSGANQPLNGGGDLSLPGTALPEGWLVLPHGSDNGTASVADDISAADVERIVNQSIASANTVRSAIRLQVIGTATYPGARSRMMIAVSDNLGNVLGLFRMRDATFFSIDVSVAKARNTSYYANPALLQAADRVDDNGDTVPDPSVPVGTAFSNRTFRFLATPYFPEGIDGTIPGAFSILRDPGFRTSFLTSTNPAVNNRAVENLAAPVAANMFQSVLGFDAFNPGRNFRNPLNIANQNGIVFFPGSAPLYKTTVLVGGFGISGDGVDQDDVVTYFGSNNYRAPTTITADKFRVRGSLLPYQKFNRNPFA